MSLSHLSLLFCTDFYIYNSYQHYHYLTLCPLVQTAQNFKSKFKALMMFRKEQLWSDPESYYRSNSFHFWILMTFIVYITYWGTFIFSFLLLYVCVLCFSWTENFLRARIRTCIYFSVSSKVPALCRIIINACYLLSNCTVCVTDSFMGNFPTLRPTSVHKWNALINTTKIDLFRAWENAALLNGQRILK